MKIIFVKWLLIIASTIIYGIANAQTKIADFKNGQRVLRPHEIGKRVADHFVATPHTNFNRPTPPRTITYPETCTWYGALTFAKETKDKKLVEQLAQRFEPLFGSRDTLIPKPDHVDLYSVWFRAIGIIYANKRRTIPETG